MQDNESMTEIQMTADHILIEPMQNSELSPGGIFIGKATTTFTKHEGKDVQITHGRVLSVGPGKKHNRTGARLPVGVEEGEYVSFSDTCHRSAGVRDKDWIIISGDDVAFISNEPFSNIEVMYN